jgi:Leucine-rich repeat (LRR) protein
MSKRSSTGECLEVGVVPTQRKKMVNLSRINTVNTNDRYMMYLQLSRSVCSVLLFSANKPISYLHYGIQLDVCRKEGFGGSRSVNLQNNNLTSVPSDILSKSSAPEEIVQLCLGSNSIMKIDQRIANLANLRHLDLSVNCILYLPEEVGLLSNLEFLDVSDNQIKEVGASIWGLSHLHTLRFRQNHISKLSDRLGSLTSLQELNFSNNELCSIPETITQLTSLEKIDLSGNILVEIPDLIAFTNLRVLHLASNRFSSVPSLCFNLELEDLDLESNLLECMPAMATTYPNLKRVVFAGLLAFINLDFCLTCNMH